MMRKLNISIQDVNEVRSQLGYDTYEINVEQPSSEVDEPKQKGNFKEKCRGFLASVKKYFNPFIS